ncbi:MAG: hypothetical protein IZT55_01320 [Anaerolineae bacterium]|nr:hypothetical protein [Anaerolineae bacterium]
MSNQTKATENQKVSQPQKAQQTPQGEAYAHPLGTALALGFAPPLGPGSGDSNPLSNQSDRLMDTRFPIAQRHSFARNINHKQGNRHLQHTLPRMIAREDDKRVMQGIDLNMLTIKITSPITKSGALSMETRGEGSAGIVVVHAPEITFSADVTIPKDVKLSEDGDGFMRTGPIQTMTSSNRTGIYTKGGKEVARYTNKQGAVRDSFRYPNEDGSFYGADRPFYQKPEGISENSPTASMNFKDRPSMSLPKEFGGGRLSKIEGADRFNTSIGIKRSGQIAMANPFGWVLGWSANLGEDYAPSGDAESLSAENHLKTWEEATGIVMDTDDYAWKATKNIPPIFTFSTVEAAMTENAASLWMALIAAKGHDPDSVANIEEALKRKDPTFQAKLTISKSVNRGLFGGGSNDTIGIFANASKQSKLTGPHTIEEGKSVTVGFKLTEIIDPSSITSSSILKVWAGGHGDEAILGDFAELPFPFLTSASITPTNADGGAGSYQIVVSLTE